MTIRPDVHHLLAAGPRALERLFDHCAPLSPEQLAGWEYNGVNLGLPAPLDRAFLKVKKVFRSRPGGVEGWNVRVRQDGLDAPWTTARIFGRPITYGRFVATPAASHPHGDAHPDAVLLDYGLGAPAWSPLRPLREYLVSLDRGRADRLLGRTYVELGRRTRPLPAFFLLLRDRPLAG